MEPLVRDKPSFQQINLAHKAANSQENDPLSSPHSFLGVNPTPKRNTPSNKSNRMLAHLLELNSVVTHLETPKSLSSPKSNLHAFSNALNSRSVLDDQPRSVKNQPRILNNSHLPAVFSTDKSQGIKIRKLIKKQILTNNTEISVHQEPQSIELRTNESPSRRDRLPKSFLSPARIVRPRTVANNISLSHRESINSVFGRVKRPAFIRESARQIPTEPDLIREQSEDSYLGLKRDESCTTPKNNEDFLNRISSVSNLNNNGSKKKIIVFKKFLSKSPESKLPQTEETKKLVADAVRFLDNAAALQKPVLKTKINLNEMLTLRKVRTTESGGTIKRMLHVPTLSIYDIHEEPIKVHESLKGWVNLWKKAFTKTENVHALKIFKCFWNSPEGSVSVLMEPSNMTSLQGILDMNFSLPETCIQQVALSITNTIHEIHDSMKVPHGAICTNEVLFDSQCQPKLSPGLSSQAATRPVTTQQNKEVADGSFSSKLRMLRPRVAAAGEFQCYTPKAINSNNSNQSTRQFANDIFDLGFLLLTCAVGNLEFYDNTGFFNLEKLKNTVELFVNIRGQTRDFCCLLHCEAELRKFHSEISPTTRLGDPITQPPLQNNLISSKNQDGASTLHKKDTMSFSLLELLQTNNRHSEEFIDFLCNCLQLRSSNRPDAKSLANHKFLSEKSLSTGPLMSIPELVATSKRLSDSQSNEESSHERLVRVFEAIKLVLLNRDARGKMLKFTNEKRFENPQSREYRKLQDLAAEFGVPVNKIKSKLRDEVLPTLLT